MSDFLAKHSYRTTVNNKTIVPNTTKTQQCQIKEINTIHTKKKVKCIEHHMHIDKADHNDIIATLYFWCL